MNIPPYLGDELHKLGAGEKLAVIQMLAAEVAVEYGCHFRPGGSYDVWSPNASGEAVNALEELLKEAEPHG